MPKRRRGFQPPRARSAPRTRGASSARCSATGAASRTFEALVERALAGIPPPFNRALGEVAIVIADEPTLQELRENGLDRDDALYGLYDGVPRTEWGYDQVPYPNKITLYRLPLEEDFPNPRELAEEGRETVIHELAHHLGIDDDRLHELGPE